MEMEKLVSLCKRRGFLFQSSEIYGGLNGFWDYGPLGVELKRNIKNAWWQDMVMDDVCDAMENTSYNYSLSAKCPPCGREYMSSAHWKCFQSRTETPQNAPDSRMFVTPVGVEATHALGVARSDTRCFEVSAVEVLVLFPEKLITKQCSTLKFIEGGTSSRLECRYCC